MKYIPYYIVFVCVAIARPSPLHAAPDDTETYTFASQRQVNHIDHVNILLEASGDVLTKSGTRRETRAAGGGPHLPPRL